VVGSRTTPPRNPPPCPSPPRAKPGVDATMQAVANTAARTRVMFVTPHLVAPPPRRPSCNHPRTTTFNLPCFALTALALQFVRPTAPLTSPNSRHRGEQKRFIGKTDLAARGRPTRARKQAALSNARSLAANRNARLPSKLLVAVASERGTRRGHGGRVCSQRERRDRDQRDQRESGDEFPHDTSPCCETLSCFLQQQRGESPCLAVIREIGLRE